MGFHFVHIRTCCNVKEMGSHWVLFLLCLDSVLNWPEDGRLRPKHVAKYNLIVIIASCLDVCCVLTVRNILYKFDNTQRDGPKKKDRHCHRNLRVCLKSIKCPPPPPYLFSRQSTSDLLKLSLRWKRLLCFKPRSQYRWENHLVITE